MPAPGVISFLHLLQHDPKFRRPVLEYVITVVVSRQLPRLHLIGECAECVCLKLGYVGILLYELGCEYMEQSRHILAYQQLLIARGVGSDLINGYRQVVCYELGQFRRYSLKRIENAPASSSARASLISSLPLNGSLPGALKPPSWPELCGVRPICLFRGCLHPALMGPATLHPP